MVEESEQVSGRIVQRGTGAHRPHARHERHRVQPHERVGEAVAAEELPVGGLIAVVGPVQERVGPHLEALDLRPGPTGSGDRAPGAGWANTPFAPRPPANSTPLRSSWMLMLISVGRVSNAQFAEQPPQVRIRAVVVDDEPGVDREHVAGGIGDVVGVGMATETILGFVEGHLVPLREHVGGGQTGDAGADDRDRPTVAEVVRIHRRRPVAGKADAQIRPQPAATAITFARDDGGTETPKPIASPASNATLTASAARSAGTRRGEHHRRPRHDVTRPDRPAEVPRGGDAGRSGVNRPASRARECGRANVYAP